MKKDSKNEGILTHPCNMYSPKRSDTSITELIECVFEWNLRVFQTYIRANLRHELGYQSHDNTIVFRVDCFWTCHDSVRVPSPHLKAVCHSPSVGQATPNLDLMKWGRYWPESLLAVLLLVLQGPRWLRSTNASPPLKGAGWTAQKKAAARYVGTTFKSLMSISYLCQRENPRALVPWI
jgi:hypothetical protein